MEMSERGVRHLLMQGLKSWWWVFLAIAVSCFIYTYPTGKKRIAVERMKSRIYQMQVKKQSYLEENENLELQISSQSDLDWIELALKRGLGLVPEGQKKIYFLAPSSGQ